MRRRQPQQPELRGGLKGALAAVVDEVSSAIASCHMQWCIAVYLRAPVKRPGGNSDLGGALGVDVPRDDGHVACSFEQIVW